MLENLVKDNGLVENVHFMGWQTEVHNYLKQSKIYVQASSSEGFSISLIEAIATGLIPVTTKAGSEEDHIKHGYNGFFFEAGDYVKLAEILDYSSNDEL